MLKILRPMRLLRSRWLRPHARALLRRSLWQITPRAVALGLACGVFFGVLIPVGQIFVAMLAAAMLRGNLLVAAAGTFITNPLTLPFVYIGAHKLGGWMMSWWRPGDLEATVAAAARAGEAAIASLGRFDVGAATMHLLVGLTTCAIAGALLAYGLGFAVIAIRQRRQPRA
ncbi:hypothetical protein PTE30175_03257 [Pandoraea terrae]|uniref:DUF2062 domain-containing protein n=1 Tax=Pandoraea terrae TaxID=1537710 RepID=A0A5E4WN53_9BURK|nr:DUF2062 domain-containing protein [Pandoraea terrae]VVE25034.1 hypothetical protein PTE30175_03257 [Pandoraea terrae]